MLKKSSKNILLLVNVAKEKAHILKKYKKLSMNQKKITNKGWKIGRRQLILKKVYWSQNPNVEYSISKRK